MQVVKVLQGQRADVHMCTLSCLCVDGLGDGGQFIEGDKEKDVSVTLHLHDISTV